MKSITSFYSFIRSHSAAIVALVCLVVTAIFLPWYFTSTIREFITGRSIGMIAEMIPVHAATTLLAGNALSNPRDASSIDKFIHFSGEMKSSMGVSNVTVYDTMGYAVWSDDSGIIGKMVERDKVKRALAGEIFTTHIEEDERIVTISGKSDFVELYMPIVTADKSVVGVAEVYFDEGDILNFVERIRLFVIVTVIATLLMFLIVFYAVYRQQKSTIEKQIKERTEQLTSALQENRTYKELVENSHDAIALFSVSEPQLLTYVNAAWEQLFGYTREEVLHKMRPLIFAAVERNSALEEKFRFAQENGMPFAAQMQWTQKNGDLRDVDVTTLPLRDESGTVIGWFNTIHDITDMQKESAWRDAIMKTAQEGIVVVGTDGLILDVNFAFANMLGYTREEMLRMRVSDIEASETPEDTSAHIKKIMLEGGDSFVTKNKRKDGTIISIHVSTASLGLRTGQIIGFITLA